MAKRSVGASPAVPASPEGTAEQKLRKLGQDRLQIEFVIEDLAKQLIIDRGGLVANGCNGCNSCS